MYKERMYRRGILKKSIMNNLFNLSNEEKNRIRGLHLTESKDKRFTSVLCEQKNVSSEMNCVIELKLV